MMLPVAGLPLAGRKSKVQTAHRVARMFSGRFIVCFTIHIAELLRC
jgi:hypothetical protein